MDDIEALKLIAELRRAQPVNRLTQAVCDIAERGLRTVALRNTESVEPPALRNTPTGDRNTEQSRKRMKKMRSRRRLARADAEDAAERAERT